MLVLSQVIDDLRRQSEETLKFLNRKEIQAWRNHPATIFLIKQLEADYLTYHSEWENGNFTSETDSGTAQLNAEALGAVDALSKIAEYIDGLADIKTETEEEVEGV